MEKEAAASQGRMSKLNRLRELQAAAQARRTAEAVERAQARADEQALHQQAALRLAPSALSGEAAPCLRVCMYHQGGLLDDHSRELGI